MIFFCCSTSQPLTESLDQGVKFTSPMDVFCTNRKGDSHPAAPVLLANSGPSYAYIGWGWPDPKNDMANSNLPLLMLDVLWVDSIPLNVVLMPNAVSCWAASVAAVEASAQPLGALQGKLERSAVCQVPLDVALVNPAP